MKKIVSIFIVSLFAIVLLAAADFSSNESTYTFNITHQVSDGAIVAFTKAKPTITESDFAQPGTTLKITGEAPDGALVADGTTGYKVNQFYLSYICRTATPGGGYTISLKATPLKNQTQQTLFMNYTLTVQGKDPITFDNKGIASNTTGVIDIATQVKPDVSTNYIKSGSLTVDIATGLIPDKTANGEVYQGSLTLTIEKK